MANVLGVYDPIFYATQALERLEKNLGMASRVHRGFERERNAVRQGSTISIRRPGNFVPQAAPGSAQDIQTDTVNIVLNQWQEVRIDLPDDQHAFTGERIIAEHVDPATYALAELIDSDLHTEAQKIASAVIVDPANDGVDLVLTPRKKLMDNNVPAGMRNYVFSTTVAKALYKESAFAQYQGSGDAGVRTQLLGELGPRYGLSNFETQNTKTFTGNGGAALGGTPLVNGAFDKNATSVDIDGAAAAGTLGQGDIITFAGDPTEYQVAADVTMSGGAGTVTLTQGLRQDLADNTAVTAETQFAATTYDVSLMFHRNALALAMAPLPSDMPGQRMFTATDANSGVSVRARISYENPTSSMQMVLDVLYGVQILDARMGVRVLDAV